MRLFFNDFRVLDPLQLWWKSENEHIPYNIKPKPHPSFFEHMSKTWYYLNLIEDTFSYTRRDCCQFVFVCVCVWLLWVCGDRRGRGRVYWRLGEHVRHFKYRFQSSQKFESNNNQARPNYRTLPKIETVQGF